MVNSKKPRKVSKRYKKIEGKSIIEMSIKTPDHLFDGRDPAPYREKDLDEDAARYILTSLQELPDDQPTQLRVYLTGGQYSLQSPSSITEAIRNYFNYEAEMKSKERRNHLYIALRALLIGLSFLLAFVYLDEKLHKESFSSTYIREGLELLVWVSLWQPVYYFLYEWLPIRDEEQLLRRAANLDIHVTLQEGSLIKIPDKFNQPLKSLSMQFKG